MNNSISLKNTLSNLLTLYSKELLYMSDVFRLLDINNKNKLEQFIDEIKENTEMLQGVVYSIEYELLLNKGDDL